MKHDIPEEHFGRQLYVLRPTKSFKSEAEYVSALSDHCKKKGYIFDPEEAKTDVFSFISDALKESYQVNGAARVDIIGLDDADNDRIQLMWCEGMATVLLTTYCGSGLRNHPKLDYTSKAASFALEFFGSFTFEHIPNEAFADFGN